MGINTEQLRNEIVKPAVASIGLLSDSAINLLLGTCAQESQMGHYIKQIRGPALSIYQIEPNTYNWVWKWCHDYHPNLYDLCLQTTGYINTPNSSNLIHDLRLATVSCRLKYFSIKEPLPPNEVGLLANYWKKYYNTMLGSGTVEQFVANYKKFVG